MQKKINQKINLKSKFCHCLTGGQYFAWSGQLKSYLVVSLRFKLSKHSLHTLSLSLTDCDIPLLSTNLIEVVSMCRKHVIWMVGTAVLQTVVRYRSKPTKR